VHRWRRLTSVLLLIPMVSVSMTPIADAVNGQTVYYVGEISAEHNRRFFDLVGDEAVHRLVITSDGGEVEAGIALGLWVLARRLEVEVADYCLSSCANYVFPAGRRKIIRSGSVVAWHGSYRHLYETGLWRDDVVHRQEVHGEDAVTAERRVRALVERLVRLEDAFFERIGVDGYVCWVGKMPPHSAPNYFFVSREDMARFGIRHVQTPTDYESIDFSHLGVDIVHIDLGARDSGSRAAHHDDRRPVQPMEAAAPARPHRP
jgi:hypothetical protein